MAGTWDPQPSSTRCRAAQRRLRPHRGCGTTGPAQVHERARPRSPGDRIGAHGATSRSWPDRPGAPRPRRRWPLDTVRGRLRSRGQAPPPGWSPSSLGSRLRRAPRAVGQISRSVRTTISKSSQLCRAAASTRFCSASVPSGGASSTISESAGRHSPLRRPRVSGSNSVG